MHLKLLLTSIHLLLATLLWGQSKWKIYLGENMQTDYLQDAVQKRFVEGYPFISFMAYHTYLHSLEINETTSDINRAGIILTAKKTERTSFDVTTRFYASSDTCYSFFLTKKDKVTHGRSALVSVMNLFSKEENKDPQDEPYDVFNYTESGGRMIYKDEIFPFLFVSDHRKDRYQPGGWLKIGGDSLYTEAASKKIKKNKKVKKINDVSKWGIVVKKENIIYAAVDLYDSPNRVYLLKSLTDKEKMLLANYLFIAVCYL